MPADDTFVSSQLTAVSYQPETNGHRPDVGFAPSCEAGVCSHDLARGVTLSELWGGDGPFTVRPTIALDPRRIPRFADDEPAAVTQAWAV